MGKYEKWLGAGLGWVVGGPLGGIIGFLAGNLVEKNISGYDERVAEGITEFEVNIIVLATHFMKLDGRVSREEVEFTRQFLNRHFDEGRDADRVQIIHHCLNREYDLGVACSQLRHYTQHGTRVQIVRFLMDLALCDGELNQREHYFILKIAGYLNVNDAEFRRIKTEHTQPPTVTVTEYEVLEIRRNATMEEIRTQYRRLVLRYHPDRNKNATEAEKKKLAQKFQQIQEAYENIKAGRGGA